PIDRIPRGRVARRGAVRKQQAEAFLRQREEDVVLAGEVAVDGGRAVFDALGDLADRDFVIPMSNEELPGSIQNGWADRFSVAFLTFFEAQCLDFPWV